ncbi:unnamed protein product [Dovyalis caffra]|uniref:Uncharacterized protein n=1 Tax=Dovyalis caffra TaxID=77055 RepID=A0AAV1SIX7_9ROSI|nr:unnamed protein product [Dovyalis caffra]
MGEGIWLVWSERCGTGKRWSWRELEWSYRLVCEADGKASSGQDRRRCSMRRSYDYVKRALCVCVIRDSRLERVGLV